MPQTATEGKVPRNLMTKHPKEAERLRKIIEAFPKVTITVLGDLVADEFVFGEISRCLLYTSRCV